MRYLSVPEILEIHCRLLESFGGMPGVLNVDLIESALENAKTTFDGADLFPDVVAKIAATTFSLISNHPFCDGNKRVGYAAMRMLLILNNLELAASMQEREDTIRAVASHTITRDELEEWLRSHIVAMDGQC